MFYRVARNALALLLTLLLPEIVRAQTAGESTVTGNGEVTIRPLPTALRMSVELQAKGSSIEVALKRLSQRRQAAVEKLEALEADAPSISFSRPGVSKVSPFRPSPPRGSYPPAPGPIYPTPSTVPSPAAIPPTVFPAPGPPAVAPPVSTSPIYRAMPTPPSTPPPVSTSPVYRAVPTPAPTPAPTPPRATTSPTLRTAPAPSTDTTPAAPSPPVLPPAATSQAVSPSAVPPIVGPPRIGPSGVGPRSPVRPRTLPIQALFHVTATVTADWPLSGEGIDQRLIAAEALKTKIEAADVAGLRTPDQFTPEENELIEEMEVPPGSYPSSAYAQPTGYSPGRYGSSWEPVLEPTLSPPGVAPPNQPNFVYVAKITDQQRKAAMAEAFATAKQQASELAGAAGKSISDLVSLHGYSQSAATMDPASYEGPYSPPVSFSIDAGPGSDAKQNEASASEPRRIRQSYGVMATFRLP